MTVAHAVPDSDLDLVLERVIDLPPERIWAAWTQRDLFLQWFTPAPWRTVDAELDLRPGGIMRTVMRSPEGEEFPGTGCVLDVVEHRRLVWTSALGPGFRPQPAPQTGQDAFLFTAIITLAPEGSGTRYRAVAVHADAAGRDAHAAMGFHEGWGAALDQLVALLQRA